MESKASQCGVSTVFTPYYKDVFSFCCRRSWTSAFGIATALALGVKLIMILHRGGATDS